MKIRLSIFILFLFSLADAQPLTIQWQKCLGGTEGDAGYSIKQFSDGSYIIGGQTLSNNGDVSGNHSINHYDIWTVKIDSSGNMLWQKCLGGSSSEIISSLRIINNGFAFAGTSASLDGDVTGIHPPNGDFWIVKCDSNAAIEWEKAMGGSSSEESNDIIISNDGGYAVIGTAHSPDFDVVGRHDTILGYTAGDVWMVKMDSVGNVEWTKCYGGYSNDEGYSIVQTKDLGYVILGSASSNDGDVQGLHGASNGGGPKDYWVCKIDSSGNIEWQKCLGGDNQDFPKSIIQTFDGGYIINGYGFSDNYDVTGHHGATDSYDAWVVKIDSIGNIEWEKSLGGTSDDYGNKIIQLADSSYVAVGVAGSIDGDLSSQPINHGKIWLVNLDQFGNIQWQQCFGGSCTEQAYDIQITTDGGAIFTGATCSNDGDVSGNHGNYDVWIVKLAPLPDALPSYSSPITDFSCYLNNTSHSATLNFYADQTENIQFSLLDITGRILLDKDFITSSGFNKMEMNMNSLSIGIYVARLVTKDGMVSKKVFAVGE